MSYVSHIIKTVPQFSVGYTVTVTITRAAALNNLSTAAELGSVELIFMNAVAIVLDMAGGCQWTSAWIALTKFLHYC